MRIIGLTGLLMIAVSVFGNTNHQLNNNGDYRSENANFQAINKQINSADGESVIRFLKEELNNPVQGELQLQYVKESPGGFHFTFTQLHDNVEIYQSQVKVNTDRSPAVRSVLRNDFKTTDWRSFEMARVDFIPAQHTGFISFIRKNLQDKQYSIDESLSWAFDFENVQPLEAKLLIIRAINSHEQFEVLLTKDKLLYFRDINVSVMGTGSVFNPDPLTTANVVYGLPFIDNNDANSAVLFDQLQTKDIEVTEVGGNYTLENNFVKIVESSSPTILPPVLTSPTFSFDRSQPEFEAVNALYHITEYQKFIQSLGFTNLVNYQIDVDVHALGGADQSVFQPGSNPQLLFGDGGVDDAEDADVVVHEYGHAISYSAAPNTNIGAERTSIDEGFGDYVASSYSFGIDTFDWFKVFTWDGHNQYWQGRLSNTAKTYPADVESSIHLTGEIWSSALMNIFRRIGDTSTILVFQSMYNYSQNMDFRTAAKLLLQADTILYDSDYFCDIYPVLVKRGLVDSISPDPCVFNDISDTTSFQLLNSAGFAKNQGAVRVFFPPEITGSKSIFMYDITGRKVYENNTNNQIVSIKPQGFAPGVYLLIVNTGNAEYEEKIVKYK